MCISIGQDNKMYYCKVCQDEHDSSYKCQRLLNDPEEFVKREADKYRVEHPCQHPNLIVYRWESRTYQPLITIEYRTTVTEYWCPTCYKVVRPQVLTNADR